MSAITLSGVTKRFGPVTALDNISLTFEENKIHGLLGRNGAGKSTLLNLIANRIFPTEGQVLIDGENVKENDRALSKVYCMGEANLYPAGMRVRSAYKWTGEFYPGFDLAYAISLSEKFELDTKKRISSLSTGYLTIFKDIAALSSGAPILLLDEPILGLDANHRELFYKELIASYSANPRTILLSTHLIEEGAGLLEKVAILRGGKAVVSEDAQALLSRSYSVSGPPAAVDAYCKDRELIGTEILPDCKAAYLLGTQDSSGADKSLGFSSVDLQKLFILLTGDEAAAQ